MIILYINQMNILLLNITYHEMNVDHALIVQNLQYFTEGGLKSPKIKRIIIYKYLHVPIIPKLYQNDQNNI